jgi:hypothetical protein
MHSTTYQDKKAMGGTFMKTSSGHSIRCNNEDLVERLAVNALEVQNSRSAALVFSASSLTHCVPSFEQPSWVAHHAMAVARTSQSAWLGSNRCILGMCSWCRGVDQVLPHIICPEALQALEF